MNDEASALLVCRDGFAIDALCFLCVKLDKSRAISGLAPRFRKRLALLRGEQARQFFRMAKDQLVPAPKDRRAFPGE